MFTPRWLVAVDMWFCGIPWHNLARRGIPPSLPFVPFAFVSVPFFSYLFLPSSSFSCPILSLPCLNLTASFAMKQPPPSLKHVCTSPLHARHHPHTVVELLSLRLPAPLATPCDLVVWIAIKLHGFNRRATLLLPRHTRLHRRRWR